MDSTAQFCYRQRRSGGERRQGKHGRGGDVSRMVAHKFPVCFVPNFSASIAPFELSNPLNRLTVQPSHSKFSFALARHPVHQRSARNPRLEVTMALDRVLEHPDIVADGRVYHVAVCQHPTITALKGPTGCVVGYACDRDRHFTPPRPEAQAQPQHVSVRDKRGRH